MPPRKHFEGIDGAYDSTVTKTVDVDIVKIAILLTTAVWNDSDFRNLNDAGRDHFVNLTKWWNQHEHMTAADYKDAILDWAFASCGRAGYDKIVSLLKSIDNMGDN